MINRSIYILFFFILCITIYACMPSSSGIRASSSQVRIIPEDLYQFAKVKKCSQIEDFYKERPEIRQPPYIYGILSSNSLDINSDFSAAFWCERPEQGTAKYALLLKLDGRIWPGGCPSEIVNQDFAGGLSVIRELNDPLEWYWNMKDQTPVGKNGEKAIGFGIQSLYDGTGNIYFCHEGNWVARPLE